MKLTDRETAPNIGLKDLIHIVLVDDYSQDPNGSSYKATIQQVVELLDNSMVDLYWVSGTSGTCSIKANNGSENDATGDYSVAEGFSTLATGNYSHAEGYQTFAKNMSSHAEGWLTISNGNASHSEGYLTQANGDYSHVEGLNTLATATAAHAGGNNTKANGNISFVHGEDSVAVADYTVVFGKNITGTTANTTYVDRLNIKTVGVYADNAAATAAGLAVGTIYRTSTGQLMIRY